LINMILTGKTLGLKTAIWCPQTPSDKQMLA